MKHDYPTPDPTDPLAGYAPVTLRARHDGWTAERQRGFLRALADTGCISEAAHATGITPRSAYRLRNHPQGTAFAAAWDRALQLAAARLMTTAYERAIKGGIREMWKDGKIVAEVREPSDRLLVWLLNRMSPTALNGAGHGYWDVMNWSRNATADLDARLDALADVDLPADPLTPFHYQAPSLADGREALSPPYDEDDDSHDYTEDRLARAWQCDFWDFSRIGMRSEPEANGDHRALAHPGGLAHCGLDRQQIAAARQMRKGGGLECHAIDAGRQAHRSEPARPAQRAPLEPQRADRIGRSAGDRHEIPARPGRRLGRPAPQLGLDLERRVTVMRHRSCLAGRRFAEKRQGRFDSRGGAKKKEVFAQRRGDAEMSSAQSATSIYQGDGHESR